MKIPVYLAGGVIRDYSIGIKSPDYDFLVLGPAKLFAESAKIELSGSRVVSFPQHKTAFFVLGGRKLEFVEPRLDYIGLSEEETVLADLERRDFTINASAARLTKEDKLTLIDPLNGIQDLHNRILRTPLNPEETLSDDPIRILRAFRFAARFKLQIVPELWEAICKNTYQLERVSNERVGEEIWKILELKKPSEALIPMFKSGALSKILPEVAALQGVEKRGKFSHKDILMHSFKVVDNTAKAGADTTTRMAALLHDVAKPMTKRFHPQEGFTFHGHEDIGSRIAGGIAKKLRLPNETVKLIKKLVLLHMRPVNLVSEEVTDSAIRRLMNKAGKDLEQQLILCRADITSGNPGKVKRYLANFDRMVERMSEVEAKDKIKAFQSPVRGDEIMQICDIQPGPMVGKIKKAIESAILDGTIPNEYEAAREYLLENMDRWLKGEFTKEELKGNRPLEEKYNIQLMDKNHSNL